MNKIVLDNWAPLARTQSEEMKILYSNVTSLKESPKVIGILSSTENEGKSYIAMELVKQYAADGKKAIFIDADLRKSCIIKKYAATNIPIIGLTEYLNGKYTINDIIYKTDNENLDFIFSGEVCENVVYLVNKRPFDDLINNLKQLYDVIIIDMPPINAVVDASLIAQKTDGVLFVIKYNSTSQKETLFAKKQLERSNIKVLGCVLNFIHTNDKDYYSYHNSYYYAKK